MQRSCKEVDMEAASEKGPGKPERMPVSMDMQCPDSSVGEIDPAP
jgi:hypothetical protein